MDRTHINLQIISQCTKFEKRLLTHLARQTNTHSCGGADYTSAMVSSQKQNLISPGQHLQMTDKHMVEAVYQCFSNWNELPTGDHNISWEPYNITEHICPHSSHTVALGLTQPLTQMSTRNLPGGKGQLAHKANNLTAVCKPTV
jgi:hypothetical protein